MASSTTYGHHFQALKLAGISNSDEEVVISGRPADTMPAFTCGFPSAADAEHIWTDQTDGSGNLIYQTNVMENTWYNLVLGEVAVTSSYGDSLSYVIDTLGDSQFPPVQPVACTTNCIYTGTGQPIIPAVTTGEMEHLIQRTIARGLVSSSNLSLQQESLEYNHPDNNVTIEANYATNELPCSLNALLTTSVGYQSAGAASSKTDYLNGITNAAAYGAQYIELIPQQIDQFLNDTSAISIYGYTYSSTTLAENQNLLSIALNMVISAMAINAGNSGLGTLCPLAVNGSTSMPWVYPY